MNGDNKLTDVTENETVDETVQVNQVERKPYVQPILTSFSAEDFTEGASEIANESNNGYYS
jgi:hypothetical protein